VRPYLKNNKSKKAWRHGSSGRVPTETLSSNPNTAKKKSNWAWWAQECDLSSEEAEAVRSQVPEQGVEGYIVVRPELKNTQKAWAVS
jgi:hypothetical protein